jgi:hypothetical protein
MLRFLAPDGAHTTPLLPELWGFCDLHIAPFSVSSTERFLLFAKIKRHNYWWFLFVAEV